MKKNSDKEFSQDEIGRIIEMAWEDRTPFEAIESNFQITESEVIDIMRREIKKSSFKVWRKRVNGKNQASCPSRQLCHKVSLSYAEFKILNSLVN